MTTTNLFPRFYKMKNVIQDYAWGSKTAMGSLFGLKNPEGKPQAEIWMGAHQNGCSQVIVDDRPMPLSAFIESNKAALLGEKEGSQFDGLPYLFKVLAADKALSIQVHPSKEQAQVGYAFEEAMGIPQSDSHRNYKDPNHKPELIYALTRYQAMNGFRDYDEIVRLFNAIGIDEISGLVDLLAANQNPTGLQRFFETMLSLDGEVKQAVVSQLLQHADAHQHDPLFSLIHELAEQYPGDIGLFSPLMLNTLTLEQGEAMYLHACTPHAYIKGTGLEIMANSDNVLRAGLTPKHMDIKELVACTCFRPTKADDLKLTPKHFEGVDNYPIPVPDFKFTVYHNPPSRLLNVNSAEILLAVDAPLTLTHPDGETMTVEKGQSIFIAASSKHYLAESAGTFARAYN
ncbi:mannose-6-phosphate isomerase, class I [Photobacterium sanctipauli]|uniref:mannose-6-phosphate isomerase n=3 Tax=Photobacterium sanctipauli TaxID=1342794 RepID=A0A2T3P0U0_9GAMM|nr:mannose-6-phosphate isomerase, class I [Photobacterium sanctipauli]PSW22120.1 mannose-6-phosphate isomerase, class I [Photobacterium sanctipauli]